MTCDPWFVSVDTRDAAAVEKAVTQAYLAIFPGGDATRIERVFDCVTQCFRGGCEHYLAIDARYHDLEHTLQGALCMVRIMAQRHRAGALPILDQHLFELGLLAILLHDTGYAKTREDTEGTGAKYTFTHVARSAQFAAQLLQTKGLPTTDITAVQNMIRCTGVDVDLPAIPFQSQLERVVGFALGTADLLGQMAAPDYVEKLPMLFAEFQEAAAFSPAKATTGSVFRTPDELIRNTPAFWSRYVRTKIDREFAGLYRFLECPYPGGPNPYLLAIEANIQRIQNLLPPSRADA